MHVMLDIETWGKKPGCDIRSIGATVFDPLTGYVGIPCPTCKGGTGPGNISTHSGDCSDCLNTRIMMPESEFYVATNNPATDWAVMSCTDQDESFVSAWSEMEKQGYIYGDDALENVHLGWCMAKPQFKYPLTRDPETVRWWNEQSTDAQSAFSNPVDLHDGLQRFQSWLAELCAPAELRLWSHGPAFDVAILAAAYDACGLPVPWHYRAPRDTRTLFDVAGIDDHSGFMQVFNTGTFHHALDDAISQAKAVCAAFRVIKTKEIAP